MNRKIIVGKKAGFCMGVRRAMDLMYEQLNSSKTTLPLYTFGPLIHNNQVIEYLEKRNVSIISLKDDIKEGTVLVRAHGIPPKEHEQLKCKGMDVIDATCPKVRAVQKIIEKYYEKGYKIAIIGDKGHAEVKGLCGYANDTAIVVEKIEDIEKLCGIEKLCVVTQTTQSNEHVDEFIKIIKEKVAECAFYNTVCKSTYDRQEEVITMAQKVDVLIVIGGKNSGNTKRLAEIAHNMNVPTFHIETEKELNIKELLKYEKIGVTAGASTPNWLILRVLNKLSLLTDIAYAHNNFKLYTFLIGLLNSGFFAGIAGGILFYAAHFFQNIHYSKRIIVFSFLYFVILDILKKLDDISCFEVINSIKSKIYKKYFKYYLFFVSAFISAYTYMGIRMLYLNNTFFLLTYIPFVFYIMTILKNNSIDIVYFLRPVINSVFSAIVVSYIPFQIFGLRSMNLSDELSLLCIFTILLSYFIFIEMLCADGDRTIHKKTMAAVLKKTYCANIIYSLSLIQFLIIAFFIVNMNISGYLFIPAIFYYSAIVHRFNKNRFNPGIVYETAAYFGLVLWGFTAMLINFFNL